MTGSNNNQSFSVKTLHAALVVSFVTALCAATAYAAPVKKADEPASIHVNQLGFLPEASKIAVVPNVQSNEFLLMSADTHAEILRGPLSQPREWDMAAETVKIADFSAFNKPGRYYVQVKGAGQTHPFEIADGVYDPLLKGAAKAFYFNRASAPIEREYAGEFARAAGHPDTLIYMHPSAASKARPVGTVLSSPKGWYDAGDYNKYVVNSGITMYTLLNALVDFEHTFQSTTWGVPESSNNVPDLLDEILWNLDWMITMQDPNDGGVYHKLTTLRFTEGGMPNEQFQRRFMVQKSTAATLDYAAVFAQASRIFSRFEELYPGRAKQYRQVAEAAWRWAQKHPKELYIQPEDVNTGAYANAKEDLKDEWLWAGAELFALTGKKAYLKPVQIPDKPRVPEWSNVEMLGVMTLARSEKTPAKLKQQAMAAVRSMADETVREYWESGYLVPMTKIDFRWGSNAVALNKAIVLLVADRLSPRAEYEPAARALFDYVLGRNPTGYAYVTGFGSYSTRHPHHRPSHYDNVDPPVPGFLAGGPQPGWQDGCEYPSRVPAKSYLDDWCSYSTNEVAINWNAPLVYVTAAMREAQKPR